MRKLLLIPLLLILAGCPKVEQDARNAAAALGGAVTAAQAQHQAECTANATAATCALITRAVSAQNALITSIETYCGWQAGVLPTDPSATCKPVTSAQAGLQAAVSNANVLIGQLKGVIQ